MANENAPMSIVAVRASQLSPLLFQTRSFGILFWDSYLILRWSKLCGRANSVAAPLRESSTFSYFYPPITVKSSVSRFAHCRPSISKERIRVLSSFTAIRELIRRVKDGRKGPNVCTELVPEPEIIRILAIRTRKLLHSNSCRGSIRPGSGTRGLRTLFSAEKRDQFSMGAWFKSCFHLLHAGAALDARVGVGVPAPYPFHAVRTASSRP